MKRSFILAALVAATAFFTSCDDQMGPAMESKAQNEIAFNTVAFTKAGDGYVTAATLYNTAIAQLHNVSPTTTPRSIWMSAYVTPQSGDKANYFVDEEFAFNAGGASDGNWHHAPKLYWPMGGTLDFLGYSANEQLTGTKCIWNEANAASQLILSISEEQSQDDILYAGNFANNTPDAPVAMVFQHTQAWIEFKLQASASDLIEIMDIKLEDIFQKGELTINGGATPSHSWNFASYRAADVVVDDNYNVYGSGDMSNSLPATASYLDMLIPAQPQTSILITYRLAGQSNVLQYRYEFPSATWAAGKKYIYQITFNPQEIIVTPSVTPFSDQEMSSWGFPDTLS